MPRPNEINPKTGKRYNFVDPEKQLAAMTSQLKAAKRLEASMAARDSLLDFTKFTMPDPEAPDDLERSTYQAAPYHVAIAEALEAVERGDIERLILCLPPRHGKSELATRRLAAWFSGRNPSKNVAVAAYSDTMATDFGSDVRTIMGTAQFKQAFPKFKLMRGGAAKDNIQTTGGGRLVFVGRGGALTGRGAHCLPAGTMLHTPDKQTDIKDVLPGDTVLSFDTQTGKPVWKKVQAISRRPQARLFRVTTAAGRVVEATCDHRFYSGGNWTNASELTPGDPLVRAVREASGETGLRCDEALAPRARPVLLLQRVLGAKPKFAAARRAAVPTLWRPRTEKAREFRTAEGRSLLLFKRLLECGARRGVRAARSVADEALRAMQRAFCAAQQPEQILQPTLCFTGSRSQYGEGGQPALEGRRFSQPGQTSRHSPVSGASPLGHAPGRAMLRLVREQEATGGSPHRREPTEQPNGELGDAMPSVPREGAFFRGEGDVVSAVEDTRRDAVVYDIQVEETECFFANGVLVHNCLLIDDLYKDHEEARSQTIRDSAWNWFAKVAMTRRMGRKSVIITMTRWHSDDIVGRITDPENPHYNAIEAKKWKIIRIPAIAEEDDPAGREEGEALWPDGPDKFDLDFLQSQQRLDPLGFAALYQQRPTVADGILFRRETLQYYSPADLPDDLRFYCASDHAVGTKQRNDPSCFIKVGVDRQDNIYLIDCIWRRMASDAAVEAMLAMGSGNMKPLLWWAERGHISKSIGPFLYKRMQETGKYINIVEVTPAVDKEQRAQSIAARVAMGKVYFPKVSWWTEKAVDEMLAFPNGTRDDFVDSLAYIGLGLGSQFGPSSGKSGNAAPKEGTFAWVKRNNEWHEARKRAASHGGF